MKLSTVENKSINTIRTLTLDAVEKAQHGHPGMPIGAAPMAYALWKNSLNINPDNANWFNRDRFVLSAGHGSMLQYALLHLSGFPVSIEDLKGFRQTGSITPGHPEFGLTPGVEVTTGPLGQGIPASVGLALAEKNLAATYNKTGFPIIDHYTYTICSDGDLMEGVSYEAASFAGHLELNKLIMLYDSNDVSLDGDLDASFSEDVKKRFESMGWQHLLVKNGSDVQAITEKIHEAKKENTKPTIIEIKTVIGVGIEDLQGTHEAHSDPIGEEAVKKAKENYNWEYTKDFHVPDEVYKDFLTIKENGKNLQNNWEQLFWQYKQKYPILADELNTIIENGLPENWQEQLPEFKSNNLLATRVASSQMLNNLSKKIPNLVGGSADLFSSNKTKLENYDTLSKKNYAGRSIWFGVREFAMGAIANGMALHHLRPFVSTFFTFSDYLRPAIRLAALMGLPVTYVFTHDSISVGQDGPTHQPVEHLASFRAMPQINLIRPADAHETVEAWNISLKENNRPTMIALCRQGVPTLEQTKELAKQGVKKGAYILSKAQEKPEGILIASGSEVQLAIQAQEKLAEENIHVNVVSFPSWNLFETQSKEYKDSVLDPVLSKRLAIELGSKVGWREYVGDNGAIMSVDGFGESGPGDEIIEKFGFTVENVIKQYKKID